MSKVLVLGAGGLVGFAVASAFVREGYQVWGVTRQEDKGKNLARYEITPIVGKAQETSLWWKHAEQADIIVEALADYQDQSTGGIVAAALIKLLQEHKEKIVIYTSGVWVAGNSSHAIVESDPANPIKLVAWRPAVEKQYLDAGAIVLRPGFVFGRNSALLGSVVFKGVTDHKASFPGTGSHSWAFVHVEDNAEAYVLAARKGSSVRGQIFNLVSHSERISDIVDAAAKLVGYTGPVTWAAPQDPFSEALALNQHFNNVKTRTVLGWNPKKTSIASDIETYYAAWKAQ